MSKSKLEAVIWDMDGVIADTAFYHLKAWQDTFRKVGVNFTEEDFRQNFGQRNDTIIRSVLGKETSLDRVDTIAGEKEANFRRLVRQDLRPLPGVMNLILSLKEHSVKMAVASSAPIENIRLLAEGLGISKYFQVIISDKDVIKGKPSPQVFLLAAERLGVKPENCIVIEDAVAGVAAAKRAGMSCLAVTNTHPRENLREADIIVDTLEEVTVNNLAQLLTNADNKELKMERSLVLIKPDATQRNLAGAIITRLEKQGLRLVAIKMLHLDRDLAKRHYAIHSDKPFFDNLVGYISSAPIIAIVFEGEKAVSAIRKIMGATDPAKAGAGTIRGDFGLDIERNTIHGSDSVETAENEIRLFFSEDEIFDRVTES